MFERVRAILSSPLGKSRSRAHELRFHPGLVAELRFAHRMLEQQLDEVLVAYRQASPAAWLASLARLDRALRAYFAQESLQLEPYLSLMLDAESDAMAVLREMRVTLRCLAHAVHEIVELRELHELQQAHFEAFGQRLEWLDESFRGCFATLERRIFPLYRQVSTARLRARAA